MTFIKLQAFACGLMLAAACTKELPVTAESSQSGGEALQTLPEDCAPFSCSVESLELADTKTQLAYNSTSKYFYVQWLYGDKIHIKGNSLEAEYSVWVDEDDRTHANLGWSQGDKIQGKAVYTAVYPSKYGSGGSISGTTCTTVLSPTQNFAVLITDESTPTIADDAMPMVGKTGSDGELISFRNAAAVLKIVPSCTETGLTLTKLVLASSSSYISGDVTINISSIATPSITSATSNTVTVENPSGVSAGSDKAMDFNKAAYFVIRPGTYSDLTLTATYTTGGTTKTAVCSIGTVKAERNKVYPISVDYMQTMLPFDVHSDEIEDLSASGTANCYLINKVDPTVDGETGYTYTEYYKFPVTVRGNGQTTDGGLSADIPAASRTNLHQYYSTSESGIFEIGPILSEGWVYFKIPRFYRTDTGTTLNGNGNHTYSLAGSELLAVNSSSTLEGSDIAWSWHIWVCGNAGTRNSSGKVKDVTIGGYSYMRVNLGANQAQFNSPISSARGLGFYYQWGRKDPLMSQYSNYMLDPWSAEDGTVSVAESVKHPLTQYLGSGESSDWCSSSSAYLWVTSSGAKTMFDPCPPGYHTMHNAQIDTLVKQPIHGASGSSQGAGVTGSTGWTINFTGGGYRYDGVYNISVSGNSGLRAAYMWGRIQSASATAYLLYADTKANSSGEAANAMTRESYGKAIGAMVRCVRNTALSGSGE